MSEENKKMETGTEGQNVPAKADDNKEMIYVSTKEAFASIGHNVKVSLTDKEAWKRRGKKALKGLAIAGAVMGGLALAEKLTRPDGDNDNANEDWKDDDFIDGEFNVVEDGAGDSTEGSAETETKTEE